MKIDEIETNSEQIRELLERAPSNILKWGITIIFLMVSVIFFAAWLIKYPTVIPANITITSKIPVQKIIAKTSGKLTQLFFKENELVKLNQIIGVIENTANFNDVILLKKKIEENNKIIDSDSLAYFLFQDNLKLGIIQPSYSNFKKAYKEYQEFFSLLIQNKELQILKEQIDLNNDKLGKQAKQLKIYRLELSLLKKDYERDRRLYSQNAISERELEGSRRAYLTSERNIENIKENSINTKITISNLKKEINSKTISIAENRNKLTQNVQDSFDQLAVSILDWEQQFLLITPIGGKVSYFNIWAKNQYVNVGDEVLTIVPENNNKIVGKMLMPVQNSGQVKQHQKVIVRLAGYPYQEYGMLIGEIKNISLAPNQDMFAVEVKLLFPLNTTYNKSIEFKSELSGTAEIVTEDLRLIERIFYQIRKILNN